MTTPAKGGAGGSESGEPSSSAGRRSEAVPPSEASDSAPQLVIWGTDVSVPACKAKFRRFLAEFVDPNPEEEEDDKMDGFNANEPLYMQRLAEVST